MEPDFDVYLSYYSRDKTAVRKLASLLHENGISVWLDEQQLRPGLPWQRVLEDVFRRCRSAAVLVGPEGLGPWEIPETRAFLSRAVNEGIPVIPVFLPGAPTRVDLPFFLKNFNSVDLRDGFTEEGLARLLWGITGAEPWTDRKATKTEDRKRYEPTLVRTPLEAVFTTVGLPQFNYVEPTIYSKVAYTFKVAGKHIVLEGPSGTGKTCLVFRILREYNLKEDEDFVYRSARKKNGAGQVTALLDAVVGGVENRLVVIDDFHTLPRQLQNDLADQLKVLSDRVFTKESPTKFVLIGIPNAASALLYNAADLGPRVKTFSLGHATDDQLNALISEGERRLAVTIPQKDAIIAEASGSFYLCQYICHEICFNAGVLETQDERLPIRYRMDEVRSELLAELGNRYDSLLVRFCAEDLNKYAFAALIGALTRSQSAVVHLHEALKRAEPFRDRIVAVRRQIASALQNNDAGGYLGRFVHYDDSIEVFSIEDPSFQYYLKHLQFKRVLSAIGCKDSALQRYFVDGKSPVAPEIVTDAEPLPADRVPRDSVFISYSHRDAEWMERLTTHLKPFVRKGAISAWTDTQIKPGSRWRSEIETALEAASVAVLLVSPDFLASDFIAENELPVLLKNAGSQQLTILWLPVRASSYKITEIEHYQAVSDPSHPLSALNVAEQDRVLVQVCEKIMECLKKNDET